jgi:hypothetical protein
MPRRMGRDVRDDFGFGLARPGSAKESPKGMDGGVRGDAAGQPTDAQGPALKGLNLEIKDKGVAHAC